MLRILVPLSLLAIGCADPPPPPLDLASAPAAPGTDFATTRAVEVPVAALVPPGLGELVHVKLSLDPDGHAQVFLGRVRPDTPPVTLSVPRIASAVEVEVYDERGARVRSTWRLP